MTKPARRWGQRPDRVAEQQTLDPVPGEAGTPARQRSSAAMSAAQRYGEVAPINCVRAFRAVALH